MSKTDDLFKELEMAKNREARAGAALEVAEEELREAQYRCEEAEKATDLAQEAFDEAMREEAFHEALEDEETP